MGKKVIHDEWEHVWGPSASDAYEMCIGCKVVRKREKLNLPEVPKKEGQEHESQPTENRRAQ